tara:strand:+ start:52 stop:303 length:252 start_codon:yes stop_codon:yes gene_type:complete
MTDSSSEPDMGQMAGELMMAKMDANKMTHLLRIGTFQLEVAPNEDIDVREFFSETLDKLISAYGEKLLEIDIRTAMQSSQMHG